MGLGKDVSQGAGTAQTDVNPAHAHSELGCNFEEFQPNLADGGFFQSGAHKGVGLF